MKKIRSRTTESTVYVILWVIAVGLYVLDVIRNRSQLSVPLVEPEVLAGLAHTVLPFLILFLIPRLMLRNRLAAYLVAVVGVLTVMALYEYVDFTHMMAKAPRGMHPAPHPFFRPLVPLPLLLDFT